MSIEHRTVGHTLSPLLAVLPVTGKLGAYVSKRYDKIQYHPVLKKNFSDIHISLRDDQAKRIRFRKGKVIVTLHLRPRKLNSYKKRVRKKNLLFEALSAKST